MNQYYFQHHAQFFAATNLKWLRILENDYHKKIFVEALKHRVGKNQLTIHGFVIMPDHFHVVWQIHDGIEKENFQGALLKFTARSILKFMKMGYYLSDFLSLLILRLTVQVCDATSDAIRIKSLAKKLTKKAPYGALHIKVLIFIFLKCLRATHCYRLQ